MGSSVSISNNPPDDEIYLRDVELLKQQVRGVKPVTSHMLHVPANYIEPKSDYKFDKRLGKGGFSVVYKATPVKNASSKHVAVKEIYLDKLNQKKYSSLLAEMNVLSQLKHPNIVRLHSVYFFEEKVYMVMDYLSGGELLNAICKKEYYTEGDARRLMRQIASALAYMHARCVIHRDLKPENLILTKNSLESDVKIIDFGFAMLTTPSSKADLESRFFSSTSPTFGSIGGTPGYLAPEIVKYGAKFTTAVDIWSVGVILYILLSGTMPYGTEYPRQVLESDHQFPEHRWKRVSSSAKNLINKMLIKDPSRRCTATELLNDSWMKLPLPYRTKIGKTFSDVKAILYNSPYTIYGKRTGPEKSYFDESTQDDVEVLNSTIDQLNGNESPIKPHHHGLFHSREMNQEEKNDAVVNEFDNDLSHNLGSIRAYTLSRKSTDGFIVLGGAVKYRTSSSFTDSIPNNQDSCSPLDSSNYDLRIESRGEAVAQLEDHTFSQPDDFQNISSPQSLLQRVEYCRSMSSESAGSPEPHHLLSSPSHETYSSTTNERDYSYLFRNHSTVSHPSPFFRDQDVVVSAEPNQEYEYDMLDNSPLPSNILSSHQKLLPAVSINEKEELAGHLPLTASEVTSDGDPELKHLPESLIKIEYNVDTPSIPKLDLIMSKRFETSQMVVKSQSVEGLVHYNKVEAFGPIRTHSDSDRFEMNDDLQFDKHLQTQNWISPSLNSELDPNNQSAISYATETDS